MLAISSICTRNGTGLRIGPVTIGLIVSEHQCQRVSHDGAVVGYGDIPLMTLTSQR